MRNRLHLLFAEMMDKIPPKAVMNAIRLEQRMLEDDLLYHRIKKSKDVVSVLSFCEFVEAAADGLDYPKVELPLRDIVLYQKIIRRLVDAGALPKTAKSKFDFSFFMTFLEEVADH